MDCFKMLLLDFVITCLIVLVCVCVCVYIYILFFLICWQLDEMFGNYMLLT